MFWLFFSLERMMLKSLLPVIDTRMSFVRGDRITLSGLTVFRQFFLRQFFPRYEICERPSVCTRHEINMTFRLMGD